MARDIMKNNVKRFAKKPDFKLVLDGRDSIRPDLLETFENEYAGRRTSVTIETDEFTAVCPWSGLPDFGEITVQYVPGRKIIELRSFKYYLFSYRTVGIYQEHLTQRLLQDLVACCDPVEMTVVVDYNVRGGVHTTTTASYTNVRQARPSKGGHRR